MPVSAGGEEATPEEEAPDDEPFRERWFFDNPSLGRAIRYTFAEKRLARAVFLNALLLVVMLALIQEAFGRAQLGLFHENISYGRLAFLGVVVMESVIISLLAPLGFVNLFEAERREECFDQVIATGATPHRVIFGRYLASIAFLAVVLFSSLPFFMTTVVLDGATLGQVGEAYLVLFSYAICITAITAAVSVALDDTALPVVVAVLAAIVVISAGFTRHGPSVFAAWSPIRHAVVNLNDIAQGLRIGTFHPPTPYGVSVPVTVMSLAYYAVFTALGLAYAYVGPDLELTEGLDSFDSVATSPKQESTRARRGVAKTLLRTVQIRFFYENLAPKAQRRSPLLRTLATIALFAGFHVVLLGALWPDKPPKSFDVFLTRTGFPYLAFSMLSLGLLALSGASARSALMALHPVKIGPLGIPRFVAAFLIMAIALVIPPILWTVAASSTGIAEAITSPRIQGLYGVVGGYAMYIFAVSLLLAMLTTNPYSATGWALIILFATNLTPAVWIPLYTGNVVGSETSVLLDLSPVVAGYAIARPSEKLPFSRFEYDEPVKYNHDPSWLPFTWFHLLVGLVCLVAALVIAKRLVEARVAALPSLAKGGAA